MMKIIHEIYSLLFNSVADVISPRHCVVCREYIGTNSRRFEFICNKCIDSMPVALMPDELMNRLITRFPADDLAVNNAFALFSLSGSFDYIKIIYSLKYRKFTRIGQEFGEELGCLVKKQSSQEYDFIIPLPVHHARKRERGFNQSDIIADAICNVLGVPVRKDLVRRTKYTKTQTLLTKEERKINVNGVFAPKSKNDNLFDKSVLLVDDVLTTGSTLNSCASVLLSMGAKSVDAAAIAAA